MTPSARRLLKLWHFPRAVFMMMQLNPPIPLDTPKGPAYAHMTIDYSQEH